MIDYVFAFRRPFSDLKTALISFVIGFLGVFTFGLTNIILNGFVLEATKTQLHGRSDLPHWSGQNLVRFFVNGLKVVAVEFVYYLPATFITLIALGSLIFSMFSVLFLGAPFDPLVVSSTIISSAVFLFIAFIFFVIGRMLSLMAIVNMAEEDKLSAAFDLRVVLRKVLNGLCLKSFIVSIAYFFIIFFVFLVLSIITLGLLGFLLGAGIFVYAYNLSVYTFMAETYIEAH